jgi:hypothetical protein
MYKIIGADRKEYGPFPVETLRQYIAENRLNGQTLVQAEGAVGWQPLAAVPELAALLPPAGAAASSSPILPPPPAMATPLPEPSPVAPAFSTPPATYMMIGGDKAEYGPFTVEQIRQYIREGRLAPSSLVRLAAGGEWKPLVAFPELAALLGGPGPQLLSGLDPESARKAAMQEVSAPAIGLIVTGILGGVVALSSPFLNRFFIEIIHQSGNAEMNRMFQNISTGSGILSALIAGALSVLILVGGLRMRQLQSLGLVRVAAVLALIPCISPCCLVGLPIGIWVLVVLNKPMIQSQFK